MKVKYIKNNGRNSLLRASRLCANNKFCSSISVLDRKRIDVDLDPDPTFHIDADSDRDPDSDLYSLILPQVIH